MAMTYSMPIFATSQPSTAATQYNSLSNGLTAWDPTESRNQNVAGGGGAQTISNLKITLANAPGAAGSGKQYVFTLRVNESDRGSITIAETALSGTLAGPVTINPGDRYNLRCVPTGSPAATGDMQYIFTVAAPGQMLSTPSAVSHTQPAGSTHYMAPDQRGNQNTQPLAKFPWAIGGTISKLYVDLETAPGGAESVTVQFQVNGADSGPGVVITGAAKTGNDLFTIGIINAGDILGYRITTSAGAATTRVRVGCQFSPSINGAIVYMFENSNTSGQTNYVAGESGSSTTESRLMNMPACTVSRLYVDTEAGAGAAGQKNIYMYRRNSADTALTCTVTGPSTTANDSADSVSVAANDTQDIRSIADAGNLIITKGSFVMTFSQAPPAPVFRRTLPEFASRTGSRGYSS